MKKAILVSAIVLMATAGVQAAFIVEPHSSGKAFDHFTGTPRYSTGLSSAIGLTATNSAYGSTVVASDVYVYAFTPGVDMDNTVLTAGTDLGNGDLATGLTGGTGLYNVYITWCSSDNVTALANITVTNDGPDVVNLDVDMDGEKASETPPDTVVSKGINAWMLIAQNVQLTAGTTYTVTQAATADVWTSLRSSGVMWEYQIPEPASLLLLGAGALAVRKFRKA